MPVQPCRLKNDRMETSLPNFERHVCVVCISMAILKEFLFTVEPLEGSLGLVFRSYN